MNTIILCIGKEALDRVETSFIKKLNKGCSFEYIDPEIQIDFTEMCQSILKREQKIILFASFMQQRESSCILQLAERLHKEHVECHAITILPFPFEGMGRKELVLKTNELLEPYCASVLSINRWDEYESTQDMPFSDYLQQEDDKIAILMTEIIG